MSLFRQSGTMFDNDMDRSPRAPGAIEKIEDLVALGMMIADLFIGISVFCNYYLMSRKSVGLNLQFLTASGQLATRLWRRFAPNFWKMVCR